MDINVLMDASRSHRIEIRQQNWNHENHKGPCAPHVNPCLPMPGSRPEVRPPSLRTTIFRNTPTNPGDKWSLLTKLAWCSCQWCSWTIPGRLPESRQQRSQPQVGRNAYCVIFNLTMTSMFGPGLRENSGQVGLGKALSDLCPGWLATLKPPPLFAWDGQRLWYSFKKWNHKPSAKHKLNKRVPGTKPRMRSSCSVWVSDSLQGCVKSQRQTDTCHSAIFSTSKTTH